MKRLYRTLLPASTLLLASLIQAQTLLPFPALKGSYQVGRADYLLTDPVRQEIFTEAPDDQRRVLISLYYPARVPADATLPPYASTALAAAMKMSQPFLDQVSLVHNDVPLADGRFPVLVFSPAFGTITHYYSSLLGQLASEGYIVAALWHPYSTNVVVFPDGSELRRNDAGTVNGVTLDEQLTSIAHIGNVWVDDIRLALDQLQQGNVDNPRLAGHFDFDRIGVLGHSLGGAAAVEAAYIDERFDAAINMDGTMFGNVIREGSRVPFLSLTAETPQPTDQQLADSGITREVYDSEEQLLNEAYERVLSQSASASEQQLPGARHNAFIADTLFFTPVMRPENKLRSIGEIAPMAAYQQTLQWVSDFMALHVKGR